MIVGRVLPVLCNWQQASLHEFVRMMEILKRVNFFASHLSLRGTYIIVARQNETGFTFLRRR
jgi:hypothetical protein